MTDDLFAEAYEERAAIMEHDAGMPRAEAEVAARTDTEEWRHACEVRAVVKMPDNETRREFLAAVARYRGQPAADRLRQDAWEAMK